MNVLFVNDTFEWGENLHHYGCKALCDSFCSRIEAAGHRIIGRVKKPRGPTQKQIRQSDMMVVNGEGFLRREVDGWEVDRQNRIRIGLKEAQKLGKKTYLVNTVWYRQKDHWGEVIEKLDGISVREPRSQLSMQRQFGRKPEVHLDESYFAPVPNGIDYQADIIYGGLWFRNLKGPTRFPADCEPTFAVTNTPWEKLVQILRGAKVYVTGHHHGVYAACRARCRFAVAKVQTHKLTGLFEWAGVELPVPDTIQDLLKFRDWALNNPEPYEVLFNFMECQKPWPIPV